MSRSKTLRRLDATEADVLRAICDFLDLQQRQGRLLYVRHQPPMMTSKREGGKTKVIFKKVRESQLGAADVIVFPGPINPIVADIGDCDINGFQRPIAVEAKSHSGKQSKEQKRWQRMAEAMGMRYLLARSLDNVMEALR